MWKGKYKNLKSISLLIYLWVWYVDIAGIGLWIGNLGPCA